MTKFSSFFLFLNDRPKGGHIRFLIKKYFYNISETINWVHSRFSGQLHMVILHRSCVFHKAGLIRCKMAVLLIFAEIFRPLYLKNCWCKIVDFFYCKPSWHEVALVTIPWTWCFAFTLCCFFKVVQIVSEVVQNDGMQLPNHQTLCFM